MDHMEGEYLEDTDNQGTVEMEMVVESEDQSNPGMQVMSILPDIEDPNKELQKASHENGKTVRRGESKSDKKSTKLLVDIACGKVTD